MTKQNYLVNIMNKTTFTTKLFVIVVILLFFLDIFDFKTNLIISLITLLIIIILYYNQKIRMIQYNNEMKPIEMKDRDVIENFEFNVVENEKKKNFHCDKFAAKVNYHCLSKDSNPYIRATSEDVADHIREDIKKGETLYFTDNLTKNKQGNSNFLRKSSNQSLVGPPNPKTLVPPLITPPIAEFSYWRRNQELTPEVINDEKERYEYESGYNVTYVPDDVHYKVHKSNAGPYKRIKKAKTNHPNRYFEKDRENNYSLIENFPYETNNSSLGDGRKLLHDSEKLLFNKSFNDNRLFKGRYNPNVFTSTVIPGEYRITDRNEPINSLMGISYPEQFEDSNYDEIQPYEDVNVSNTYDPRFSGYGTSYRSYVDNQLGQPRFYYDDIDAVKMPNYISRSNIDTTDFADSYGPLREHNPYTRNIHELADNAYIDSTNDFRADLQRSRMRKRNAEEWQQRLYPINKGGQRMLK